MSENNEQNETSKDESKLQPESLPNAEQPDSNDRSSFEYNSEAGAVLSNNKTDKSTKEIVINIENETIGAAKGDDKIPENLNYLLYSQYGQHIRPPKHTWVYFQKVGVSDNQVPLDYDPSSRNGFVRIVLMTVLIMLLVTAAFVVTVLITDEIKVYFKGLMGLILGISALFTIIAISYTISCSACARSFPCNIIILVVTVIAMSIICAWITARFRSAVVFYALIATCIIVGVCVLLSLTGFDFTSWLLYLVIIGAAFGAITLVVMIGMLITGKYLPIVHLVILIVSVLLNAVFLVVELQMILGGGAIELGEDDFALGAFLLYTSIIDMFMQLVQTIGIVDLLT